MREIKTVKKIDVSGAPALERQIQEALEEGETELVIDMGDTEYISSVGLRVFVSTQKKVNRLNGSLLLRNVTPKIMEIFEVTGFGGVLTMEMKE